MMNAADGSGKCSGGVTLWEIVLIAVIVGVMAAVLLPALADSRRNSDESICQSNLHELGIALITYIGDYDSVFPSSKLVSHSKKWNKADFLIFATGVGKLPAASAQPHTYLQVIYDYLKNKDIVFCPSDPSNHAAPGAKASYWWKTAMDKAWYGEGCKPCRKELDFGYTSDMVLLYEHEGWHSGGTGGLKNGTLINVAFMDCHVKMITLRNATSGDPKNCAANSDGEPMYYNCNFTNDTGPASSSIPATYVDAHNCGDRF